MESSNLNRVKPYNCVMLVEDSVTDTLIAEILIRNAGLTKHILSCCSANAALSYLAGWDSNGRPPAGLPELILLDLGLPLMDGFEFLSRLGRLSLPVQPQVYILTASAHTQDQERARTYACVKGVIVKPLSAESLQQLTK